METLERAGQFIDMLKRNNSKIREDRATAIVEDAEMIYKRTIEDMELQMKRLTRKRDEQLDLSPSTADSLTLTKDFDPTKFVNTDIDLGVEIRTIEIKLEIANKRYKELFG